MTKKHPLAALILASLFPLSSLAAEDWLVISNTTVINAGREIELDIIKPNDAAWPETLKLELSAAGVSEEAVLTNKEKSTNSENRRSYTLVPGKEYVGVVEANLVEVESNKFLLLASGGEVSGPVKAVI